MRRAIPFIFIIPFLFCVFTWACTVKKPAPVPAPTPTPTVKPVPTPTPVAPQDQYAILSRQVADLQKQVDGIQNASRATSDPALASKISAMEAKVAGFTAMVNNANTQSASAAADIAKLTGEVNRLKSSSQASSTVIGVTPVTVNGLSVSFLINNIYLPVAAVSVPVIAQPTIRIANGTAGVIAAVNIVGAITFSSAVYSLAVGYPSMVDSEGLIIYNYYFNGSNAINFEAYKVWTTAAATATAMLSIPKGGVLTLRPKVSLMSSTSGIPAMTVVVSISNISYTVQ